MNNTEPISLNCHLEFVESLAGTKNRACYLVKEDTRLIGVIQLNEIYNKMVRDVGMYVNPTLLNRGVGLRLGFYGARYLFTELGFKILFFKTLCDNKDALNLWRVLGIRQAGSTDDNIIHGELFATDFFARPKDFREFVKSINTI